MELEPQQTGLEKKMDDLQVLNTDHQSSDVVLKVDDREFPSHRAILSANCLYFNAMFNGEFRESNLSAIPIQGITAVEMETVLNFLYEGKVALDEEKVESVFYAADFLGVSSLRKACVSFLEERADHSNCLWILDLARSFFITPLVSKCENLLYDGGFEEICKHKEFLSQAKEWVVELLTSDQLHVDREEILVEAVLKWVHHNPNERKGHLKELLELVHLPLVDPDFFVNTVETDELVRGCKECRPLLLEAQRFQASGVEVDSPRTRPRRALGRAEMIVKIRKWYTKSEFNQISEFNPHTRKWVKSALPLQNLEVVAVCVLQNNIYVSGNQQKRVCLIRGEVVSQMWRYTPQLDHWVQIAPLAEYSVNHSMAALHGKLYMVKRLLDNPKSSVEVYSAHDNQWQTVASPPVSLPLQHPAVVSCSGKLYVFGLFTSNSAVHSYDPQDDQWADMGTCPFILQSHSPVTHNSTIYIVGGPDQKQICCYTPKTNAWSTVQLPFGPMKRFSFDLTVCEGKIYVFNSSFDENDFFPTSSMWAFCPQTRKLTKVEQQEDYKHDLFDRCVTITRRLPEKNTIHSR